VSERVTGYLQVGINDDGEVVINHDDLKPDENGVGHIVFSPGQARNLAILLLQHASQIDGKILTVKTE
jgi:hypothetical protein